MYWYGYLVDQRMAPENMKDHFQIESLKRQFQFAVAPNIKPQAAAGQIFTCTLVVTN